MERQVDTILQRGEKYAKMAKDMIPKIKPETINYEKNVKLTGERELNKTLYGTRDLSADKIRAERNLCIKETYQKKYKPGIRIFKNRDKTPDIYDKQKKRGVKYIKGNESHIQQIFENDRRDLSFDIIDRKPHVIKYVSKIYNYFIERTRRTFGMVQKNEHEKFAVASSIYAHTN